jgi:quercetin dioxygenase-like cupin family protein
MGFSVISRDQQTWHTRPHDEGEPARHVAELSAAAGMSHVRANVWRYEPGAAGKRHRHPAQDETFVVLSGTLSMYVGDPPERRDVAAGSLVHIEAGTPLQSVNHGADDLVVYVHGWPPEDQHAELLPSAVT